MSDDEMSMGDDDMQDISQEEEEDYGFEYSSGEEEEEEDDAKVEVENKYYNAKGNIDDDPALSLKQFIEVADSEMEMTDWGFKALKHAVKLAFSLHDYATMMKHYKRLLDYTKATVTQNQTEKTISSILEIVGRSDKLDLLQEFYQCTLDTLLEAKNERLWFKVNLKLAEVCLENAEYGKTAKIIKDLRKWCEVSAEGVAHLSKKGTQLLQVYALEIQLYTATKNNKKLQQIYQEALKVKSGVPHPRIAAIIHECGGKGLLLEKNYAAAYNDFFEAFKNYDEAGSPKRLHCLKYLVLANLLGGGQIDPFDSPEAKAYATHTEIVAFRDLVTAFATNEVRQFESVLKKNYENIMNDPFIREHIQELLKTLRTRVLVELLKPYTRLHIPFISQKLNIPAKDVEELLVSLILDNRVQGSIDQVNQRVILHRGAQDMQKYSVLNKWGSNLASIHHTLVQRV